MVRDLDGNRHGNLIFCGIPGMGVVDVAQEMIILADNLRIGVVAEWNGVDVIALPGIEPSFLMAQYDVAIKSKHDREREEMDEAIARSGRESRHPL